MRSPFSTTIPCMQVPGAVSPLIGAPGGPHSITPVSISCPGDHRRKQSNWPILLHSAAHRISCRATAFSVQAARHRLLRTVRHSLPVVTAVASTTTAAAAAARRSIRAADFAVARIAAVAAAILAMHWSSQIWMRLWLRLWLWLWLWLRLRLRLRCLLLRLHLSDGSHLHASTIGSRICNCICIHINMQTRWTSMQG
jgi:hypothetical protein